MARKKAKKNKEPKLNILQHKLVPKHEIINKEEEKKIFDKYDIIPEQLPKILNTDPACIYIGAKPGQIIKVTRKSQTANEAIAYRLVVESDN